MKHKKTIPYYSKKKDTWRVKIKYEYNGEKCSQTEEGSLTDVVCEYLRTSLYYPFWLDENRDEDSIPIQPHTHSFDDALQCLLLLDNPEHFSIEGFEEYYSKQEIELLQKFQKKLLEDKGKQQK